MAFILLFKSSFVILLLSPVVTKNRNRNRNTYKPCVSTFWTVFCPRTTRKRIQNHLQQTQKQVFVASFWCWPDIEMVELNSVSGWSRWFNMYFCLCFCSLRQHDFLVAVNEIKFFIF